MSETARTTAEQRAQWAQLAEAATRGPWVDNWGAEGPTCVGSRVAPGPMTQVADFQHERDAGFCIAARGAVPVLLSDVDALTAQLAERTRERDEAKENLHALNLQQRYGACEVCWTSAWAPCPPGTPDAIEDPHAPGNWIFCQQCAAEGAVYRYHAALLELVDLKRLKEADGKTPEYEQRQPLAWEAARRVLGLAGPHGEVTAQDVAHIERIGWKEVQSIMEQMETADPDDGKPTLSELWGANAKDGETTDGAKGAE